jgi:alkanesulfonate monooxygenase SsuD/methylene tetrahydromethanopterin reductase-like flavin-dependent oxidoreductase (luciferase family)
MKLLTALWSQERPAFKGKTIAAEGFYFNPKTVQQPRPPFVIGGHGEAAYKRAARLADGFYITAQNMDDARQQIRRLREIERDYQRSQPLEITMGASPITVDTVKQLEDVGVARIIPGRELISRDSLAALRSFHDRVLSKVSP